MPTLDTPAERLAAVAEATTVVIFRRFRSEPHDVIAVFPEIPADYGHLVQSYMHIGQHGGCDYQTLVDQTRPAGADDDDVKELRAELERIGYRLEVRRRVTAEMDDARRAAVAVLKNPHLSGRTVREILGR